MKLTPKGDMMKVNVKACALACVAVLSSPAQAQEGPAAAIEAAKAYRQAHGAEIVRGFADLLAIPNHARDAQNIQKNAQHIAGLFAARGFDMELLKMDGAPPLIYGALKSPGAERTIAIYVHYDGQPVEEADWTNPPFAPTLYTRAITDGGEPIDLPEDGDAIDSEWRLYARSAGDDKAPIPALLAAIDALQEVDIPFTSNIILVFDGEEEAGSDHLDDYLGDYAGKFADVDLWLFCDGPIHQSGRPQLVFGVRGVAGLDVTVYGPNRGLHSGHYGNWAPGPGWRLASLLASMKDDDGTVRIKNFYKSTPRITKAEHDAIAAIPAVDDALRETFGLAETEGHNAPLAERVMLPALNLKGIKSAEVGDKARNVIPPSATASIGLRLAKGNDPEAMLDLIEAHIEREGYHIVRDEPDLETRLQYPLIAKVTRSGGYPAVRSAMDDPAVTPLVSALRAAADDLVLIPTFGGTLPLYMFEEVVSAPIVILPIANYDDNQHAADENLRLGNLFYGVEAYAAVLTME